MSAREDFNIYNGRMTWFGAQAWVGYLNNMNGGEVYQDYTGWRLLTMAEYSGELRHLFYSEFGETVSTDGGYTLPTYYKNTANYNLFSNVQNQFGMVRRAYPLYMSTLRGSSITYPLRHNWAKSFSVLRLGGALRTSRRSVDARNSLVDGQCADGFAGLGRRKAATLAV